MSILLQPGKLPLKHVATINDEVIGENTDPEFEIKYIDIGNVTSTGEIQGITTYRFENAPSRARRVVRNGDVIISTVRTYLQAIAPIESPPENLIVSTGFAVVRPRPGILDTSYCKYALRESEFLHEVVARSVGVSYPAITATDLGSIHIYVPPLTEQRTIADYLDKETARIDALIAAKERLLDLLIEKRRTLINITVKHGLIRTANLRKVNIPWLDVIPEHWKIERGKYLFLQSSLPVRADDETVTCFRDGQVTLRRHRREEGFTNAIQELGYQGVRSGQLVLHSMDAFAGAIGVSESDGKCSPEYIICNPASETVFNPYYGYLLRVMALQGFIQASCPAVRERAPRIHFSDLADMLLPVPPVEEQKEIVTYIAAKTRIIDSLKNAAILTIKLLRERRAALIAAAVTGQIEVMV